MFSPLLTQVSSKGGVNLKEHKLTWQKKTELEWVQWPFSIHLHSTNHPLHTYTCHIPPYPQIDDPVSCFEKTEAIRQNLHFPIIQSFFFFFSPATSRGLEDLSSSTRASTWVPAVKAMSPNPWTTREFPPTIQSVCLQLYPILCVPSPTSPLLIWILSPSWFQRL